MVEKNLLKLNKSDIEKYFPKMCQEGILNDTTKPKIIIPTTSKMVAYPQLEDCKWRWKAANIWIEINQFGFLTFTIAWESNYQIEVEI